MKHLTWAALVAALTLGGCGVPVDPISTETEVYTGDHGGGGELVVRLAHDLGTANKTLLAPAVTQAADVYQLVAFSGATATMRVLKPGVANVLSLAPGTWRVEVLAGLKRSSTSTTVFLLGSAGQDGVVVAAGSRTTLNLTLKAVDTTFELLGTGIWGDTMTVRAQGKSRNPAVGVFTAETAADRHPRFRSLEFWGGYKDPLVTGGPTDWTAELSAKVPEGVTDVAAWLIGSQVALLDGTDTWVPSIGLLEGSWEWINRADMADTHALAGEGERHAAAQAPPTGLNLTLTWE